MKYLLTIFASLALLFPSAGLARSFSSIGEFLKWVIDILLGFGAIAALLGLVFAGYKYITSQGNPEATAGAKSAALYAIIGLVVILLSVLFVDFIFETLSVDMSGISY